MRGSRFALLGLTTLLLLAAAVAVTPSLLDWNRYRDNIASLASAVLGRPVRIEGEVALHLLPHAEFSAGRISIADGGDGVAIQARQLRLRVALAGLMTGHLDPLELVLQQAQIALPWPFNPAALTHRPDWLSGLSARIEDATVTVGALQFTAVDGSFDPEGPPDSAPTMLATTAPSLAARAHGRFMNQSWRVMARLGEPQAVGSARSVPIEVVLDGEGPLADTGATLNGRIAADGAIGGTITGRGPDLSQLVPGPPVSWRADGRVSIADGLAVANDLALQLAGATGRGAVALRLSPLPRLDLALTASRIDLDAWIEALRPHASLPSPAPGKPARAGLVTGINLSANTATFRTGTLRHVRIAVDLRPQEVTLREASATLPGEATLATSGRISLTPPSLAPPSLAPPSLAPPSLAPPSETTAQTPQFDGQITAQAPDLRATLAWLQQLGLLPPIALPAGVLQAASGSSQVRLANGRLSLAELAGRVDGSRISGTIALQGGTSSSGGRSAVAANVRLEQLRLDPWLRNVSVDAASLQALPQQLAATGLNADLRLEIGRAVWNGGGAPLTIDHLVIDGTWDNSAVSLRSMQGGAAGLQAAVSGRFPASGGVEQGQLLLVGADAMALRPLLPQKWRGTETLWHAPLDLKLTGDGPARALATQLHITLGDTTIEASPVINLPARTASGPLTVRHPGAPRLLRLLGLPGAETWLGDGSFSLITQLSASATTLTLDPFETIAADLHAHGRLALNLAGVPSLTGQVAFDTLSLPLPAWSQPLPLLWAQGWQADLALAAARVQTPAGPLLDHAATQATLKDGVARLNDLAATLAGGKLTGSLQLDTTATPPTLDLGAQLHGASISEPLVDLPLDLSEGTLDGNLTLQAAGYSPSGLLATLAGGAHADLQDGRLTGLDADAAAGALRQPDPAAVAEIARTALAGGTTSFDKLSLDLKAHPGLIDATGTLKSPQANTALSGTIDLSGRRLDLAAHVQPAQPGLPGLTLSLTGALQNPTRTIDLSALATWLAGR